MSTKTLRLLREILFVGCGAVVLWYAGAQYANSGARMVYVKELDAFGILGVDSRKAFAFDEDVACRGVTICTIVLCLMAVARYMLKKDVWLCALGLCSLVTGFFMGYANWCGILTFLGVCAILDRCEKGGFLLIVCGAWYVLVMECWAALILMCGVMVLWLVRYTKSWKVPAVCAGIMALPLWGIAYEGVMRRLWQSRFALDLLPQWWKHGFGLGGFKHLALPYAYGKHPELVERLTGEYGRSAIHCDPLEGLLSFGLPVFLVLVLCLVLGTRYRKGVYCWCGICGTLVYSFFDIPFQSPVVLVVWVMMLGMGRRKEE